MSYGDKPKRVLNDGEYHNRIPGLRNTAPNGKCVTYKIIDGKKQVVKVENETL